MASPSAKMMKILKSMQKDLNKPFHGSKDSFDDVSKYIGDNMEAWKESLGNRPPSEKQIKGCELITKALGHEFEGSTTKEASDFLDEYLKEAIDELKERVTK